MIGFLLGFIGIGSLLEDAVDIMHIGNADDLGLESFKLEFAVTLLAGDNQI